MFNDDQRDDDIIIEEEEDFLDDPVEEEEQGQEEEAIEEEIIGDDTETEEPEQEPEPQAPRLSQRVNRGGQSVNRGFETDVDMVFVIDLTYSMQPLLDNIKQHALVFNEEVREALKGKNRTMRNLRIKIIGFRDHYFDWEDPSHPPIEESEFFDIPEQQEEFAAFLRRLEPAGGEDDPESALEALHLAFHSDWKTPEEGKTSRQMVILFTDNAAHPLDDPMRTNPEFNSHYPEGIPESLEALQDEYMDPTVFPPTRNGLVKGHRLILFAPENMYPWEQVKGWEATTIASMDPENGLDGLDMGMVYALIGGSMN